MCSADLRRVRWVQQIGQGNPLRAGCWVEQRRLQQEKEFGKAGGAILQREYRLVHHGDPYRALNWLTVEVRVYRHTGHVAGLVGHLVGADVHRHRAGGVHHCQPCVTGQRAVGQYLVGAQFQRAGHLGRHVQGQLGATGLQLGDVGAERLSLAHDVEVDDLSLPSQDLQMHRLTHLVGCPVKAEEHLRRALVGGEGGGTRRFSPLSIAGRGSYPYTAHIRIGYKVEFSQAVSIGAQFVLLTSHVEGKLCRSGRTVGRGGEDVDRVFDAGPQPPAFGHHGNDQWFGSNGDYAARPLDVARFIRYGCRQRQVGRFRSQPGG